MERTNMKNIVDEPQGRAADPCVMVIFGASGDLTKRKLIPALHNLAKSHLLSQEFAVVGLARSDISTEDFRQKVNQDLAAGTWGPKEADDLMEQDGRQWRSCDS